MRTYYRLTIESIDILSPMEGRDPQGLFEKYTFFNLRVEMLIIITVKRYTQATCKSYFLDIGRITDNLRI